ncbi:MAG: hypothetical protein HIU81_04615 [Acidobacteria bacterium]|nr:hypothetical protein [Acidobacteriota bacterium]
MYLTQGLHRSLQSTPNAPATSYLDRVRTFAEAAQHTHVRARGTLSGADNRIIAAPAPRFSRSGAAAEKDQQTSHQQGDPQ